MNAQDIAKEAKWGYLSSNEVDALHALINMISFSHNSSDYVPVVVNLGAGFGTSSLAMAETREIMIYSVDNIPGFQEIERNNFIEAGRIPPLQIYSNSHDPNLVFKDKIDMLFIDADHREEEVLLDIRKWLPYMKPDGIVAFHDYDHPNFPGVKRAIRRTRKLNNRVLLIDTIIAFRLK